MNGWIDGRMAGSFSFHFDQNPLTHLVCLLISFCGPKIQCANEWKSQKIQIHHQIGPIEMQNEMKPTANSENILFVFGLMLIENECGAEEVDGKHHIHEIIE